jgi:hypothetical protein
MSLRANEVSEAISKLELGIASSQTLRAPQ